MTFATFWKRRKLVREAYQANVQYQNKPKLVHWLCPDVNNERAGQLVFACDVETQRFDQTYIRHSYVIRSARKWREDRLRFETKHISCSVCNVRIHVTLAVGDS